MSDDGTTQYCYRVPDADPATSTTPHIVTTAWDCTLIGRPAAATMGLTGMSGTYQPIRSGRTPLFGGYTVYRPRHWAFAGTDLYYGDLLGGTPVNLATFELDAVEYTFRRGLLPDFRGWPPESLEILAWRQRCAARRTVSAALSRSTVRCARAEQVMEALGDLLPAHCRETRGVAPA